MFLLALLAGCADSESRPPAFKLRFDTVIQRRASLSLLRRAWSDRPDGVTDDHCWYERRLLNRSGFFGRQVRNTESYEEACQFWMSCVREHLEAYDDETFKGFRGR